MEMTPRLLSLMLNLAEAESGLNPRTVNCSKESGLLAEVFEVLEPDLRDAARGIDPSQIEKGFSVIAQMFPGSSTELTRRALGLP